MKEIKRPLRKRVKNSKREKCTVEGCLKMKTLNYITKDGEKRYRSICYQPHKDPNYKYQKKRSSGEIKRNYLNYRRYRQFKKKFCEKCGFTPLDPCQLDVDHINEEHYDNGLCNLQTLCANCHRLKTHKPEIFFNL